MLSPDEKDIRAAERMQQFLADETVIAVLDRLDRKAYAEFKSAQSQSARTDAWAMSRAIDELRAGFRSVVVAGQAATARAHKAQRADSLKRSTT